MASLNEIKFMPLSDYNISSDTADSICAVEVTSMFGLGCFLDWTKVVTLSLNTTYTVGSGVLANYKAGYVWLGKHGRGGWASCTIINTTFLSGYDYEDGHESKLILFPVSTGDYFSAAGSATNFIFIPTIWSL